MKGLHTDRADLVTFDIPLFIRLLEYAKEDAKTDMDLHSVAEKAITLSKEKESLTMADYEALISVSSVNEESSVGSVMGSTSDPSGGFFIGPLGKLPNHILRKRIYYPDKTIKNGDGTAGKIVEPPQGYVSEGLFDVDGEPLTEQKLVEWFGGSFGKKPSFNGGKIVMIEPKCLAFPYCSQGAVDKPIKLIGETKESMCPDCYDYCSQIGEIANKKPEIIAKIIRERYL